MRFWRSMAVFFFLGFYFLSITPVHFYTHNTEFYVDTHADDGCTVVVLMQAGQGIYLHSGETTIPSEIIFQPEFQESFSFTETGFTAYEPAFFQLRAPPFQI